MNPTPFQDAAKTIARRYGRDYARMQVESKSARSHAWWRNLTIHGAWGGPGSTRVGPPTPEAIPGIAALFGTSEKHVKEMIAADWYRVQPDSTLSPQAQKIAASLEGLSDGDFELIESMARRLSPPPKSADTKKKKLTKRAAGD